MESYLLQDRIVEPLNSLRKTELTSIVRSLNDLRRFPRIPVSLNKSGLALHIAHTVNTALRKQETYLINSVINILNRFADRREIWVYAEGTVYNWRQLTAEQRARIEQPTQRSTSATAPPPGPTAVPLQAIRNPAFRNSPFYVIVEPVTNGQLCTEATYARSSRTFIFTLNETQRGLLKQTDSNGRPLHELRMFCAAVDTTVASGGAPIEFPHVCELKVNQNVISGQHLRGLKNKPGTVHPYNITSMCGIYHKNYVELVYANTTKSFVAIVQLVKRMEISMLVESIKSNKFITKEQVLSDRKKHNEDADVVVESETVSTKCPLSFTKITTPCRAQNCQHAQCFDATTFLAMNEQTPTWSCPVCNKQAPFHELVVDGYFAELLANATSEFITIDPEGNVIASKGQIDEDDDDYGNLEQKPVKEETNDKSPSEFNAQHVEVLVLDDSDDNDDNNDHPGSGQQSAVPQPRNTNAIAGAKRKLDGPAAMPVQSSLPKRPNNVIDLTLDSDEEDEEAMNLPEEPLTGFAVAPQGSAPAAQSSRIRLPNSSVIPPISASVPPFATNNVQSNIDNGSNITAAGLPRLTLTFTAGALSAPLPAEESNALPTTDSALTAVPLENVSTTIEESQGNSEQPATSATSTEASIENVSASNDESERVSVQPARDITLPESSSGNEVSPPINDAQGNNDQQAPNATEAANTSGDLTTSNGNAQQDDASSMVVPEAEPKTVQESFETNGSNAEATAVIASATQSDAAPNDMVHTENTDTQQAEAAAATLASLKANESLSAGQIENASSSSSS